MRPEGFWGARLGATNGTSGREGLGSRCALAAARNKWLLLSQPQLRSVSAQPHSSLPANERSLFSFWCCFTSLLPSRRSHTSPILLSRASDHGVREVPQKTMKSFWKVSSIPAAGARKGGDEPGKLPEQEEEEEEEESQVLHGTGHCKWFNVRMGFGFISMINREGSPLESPVDVFVHQSKLYMEGFRSLKEGEPVEFTFKKSSKGLESIRVTGPGGIPCLGSERRPKGKTVQKRKPKGDRCYNCGGLDHHAKECTLPPQPKKCHYCQSIMHMVANCPHKTVPQQPTSYQGRYEAEPQPSTSAFLREGGGAYGYISPSYSQEGRADILEHSGRSPQEAASSKLSPSPEEQSRKGPSVQKRKKT